MTIDYELKGYEFKVIIFFQTGLSSVIRLECRSRTVSDGGHVRRLQC
jgi:hypothetical protein